MSHYINTFDHELVGFFAGLPVFHPLEVVNNQSREEYEFNCNPTNLIVGGQTGARTGFVLLRPDLAVGHFILDWTLYDEAEAKRNGREPVNISAWNNFLHNIVIPASWSEVFYFPGWTVEDYCALYDKCNSKTLNRPYDVKVERFFEIWLAASLGEFIFFSMLDLVPNLEKQLPKVFQVVKQAIYRNILVPPPGYPSEYGRVTRNGKITNGKVLQMGG